MVPIQNSPVHNKPLKADHSKQITFITCSKQTTFITDPFVTDHVDNGPLLNVYCSVDAKSPNHFAQHPLPRPALGTNSLL